MVISFLIELILIIGSLLLFHSLAARTLLKQFNNTVKYYSETGEFETLIPTQCVMLQL